MNNFSFWELYTSQWSFKNEGKTLLLYIFISFVVSLIICYTTGFGIFLWIWPTLTLWLFCFYQGIKTLVFALLCYGVCYYAKNGDSKFIQRYYEMLTWRK